MKKNREETIKISAEKLAAFVTETFRKVGVPQDNAEIITDVLIEANLRGIDTHGVMRVPIYIERFQKNLVNPCPKIKFEERMPSVLLVDGDNGPGHVVGTETMNRLIEKADKQGICIAGIHHSNHFGMAAYYTIIAARKDMIGIALSNAPANVAPFGSRKSYLGTNPLSVSIPTGGTHPIVADMATSRTSLAAVITAQQEGREIPENWALGPDGKPTTDPSTALEGTLLPMAGPKGYCISLLIDILCGVFTGALFGQHINALYGDFENKQNLGHFMGAIKTSSFMENELFLKRLNQEMEEIRELPTAQGFDEVLLPGDIEYRTRKKREKEGIPIGKEIVTQLEEVAEKLGIETDLFKQI